jgi:hypothetical protein
VLPRFGVFLSNSTRKPSVSLSGVLTRGPASVSSEPCLRSIFVHLSFTYPYRRIDLRAHYLVAIRQLSFSFFLYSLSLSFPTEGPLGTLKSQLTFLCWYSQLSSYTSVISTSFTHVGFPTFLFICSMIPYLPLLSPLLVTFSTCFYSF